MIYQFARQCRSRRLRSRWLCNGGSLGFRVVQPNPIHQPNRGTMKWNRFVGAGAALAVVLAPMALAAPADAAARPAHHAAHHAAKTVTCAKGKKVATRKKCRAGEVRLKLKRAAVVRVARARGTLVLCYARNGNITVVRGTSASCKKHRMTYISLSSLGVAGPQGPAGATGPQGATGAQGPQGQPGLGGTASPILVRGTAYANRVAFGVINYDPGHVAYQVTATSGTPSSVAACTGYRYSGGFTLQPGLDGCGEVTGLAPDTLVTLTVIATENGNASPASRLMFRTNGLPPGAPIITTAPTWVAGIGSGATHALSVPYTDGTAGSGALTGHSWTLYLWSGVSWSYIGDGSCLAGTGSYPDLTSPCIANVDSYDYASGARFAVKLYSENNWGSSPASVQFEASTVAP